MPGVKDVLHPVDNSWPAWLLGDVHNAFKAQQIGATVFGKRFQKERQCDSLNWRGAHDRICCDLAIVVVVIVSARITQPRIEFAGTGLPIAQSDIKRTFGFNAAMRGAQGRCAGVEIGDPAEQLRLGITIRQIKLGQNNPIGDGNLLSRNDFAFERGAAVHGIDCRHHAAKRQAGRDGLIRHQRVEDRRRVGKSAGFDHDPIEPGA